MACYDRHPLMLRVAVSLLCLILPFVLVRQKVRAYADGVAAETGRTLAALVPPRPAPPPLSSADAAALVSFAREEASALAKPPVEAPRKANKTRAKAVKPKEKAVFVPASVVLRLANGGASVPRAVPVPALGERPAGLRLLGVSSLGVGMRDGDVLTRVLGAEVGSVGEVVARVIAARNQRARNISGEFWRDGARWVLVVEQPYVDPGGAAPGGR